jgi:Type II secretory pathway, ATPase PulE/Tfp pilus assembly pathway, ATPase PilB
MGTLHVKDVRGVITRLENLKVERDKILNQLRGS